VQTIKVRTTARAQLPLNQATINYPATSTCDMMMIATNTVPIKTLASTHDSNRLEKTKAKWYRFTRNFDGLEGSAWTEEMESELCEVMHEDCVYELPSLLQNFAGGIVTPTLSLSRRHLIYCFRQAKHMRVMMETEWMVEAVASGDSPFGQLQGSTSCRLPTSPMGLKQQHCSTLTLGEDGRIIHIKPQQSNLTHILSLQLDFLSLTGRM
jgi:hypothetical protein